MPDDPKPASQTPAIHSVHIEQQDAHVWAYNLFLKDRAEAEALWAILDAIDTCKAAIEETEQTPRNLTEVAFQRSELPRLNGELQSLMRRLKDNGVSEPEPQAAPAVPATDAQPQAAPLETPVQRRARWLDLYGKGEYGALQRVHERELLLNPKADRSYIGKQIKVARAERGEQDTKKSSGAWGTQLVTNGKRNG